MGGAAKLLLQEGWGQLKGLADEGSRPGTDKGGGGVRVQEAE